MGKKIRLNSFAVIGLSLASCIALSQDDGVTSWSPLSKNRPKMDARTARAYREAIQRTANMVSDSQAQNMVGRTGLNLLNLTWEDTGRYKGSSVGPNISDMTIQVGYGQSDIGVQAVRCMPIIRYPNFSDKTCDIDPSDFTLLVGNEKGKPLQRVSLRDFLDDPDQYLSNSHSWPGRGHSLSADRDSKVLVSAQACFLPIPKEGKATFNPVLFNYMSERGNPGVLTILATREGTSTTIIDNTRDSFAEGSSWGQRLFHNEKGLRASLTGERLSDFHPSSGAVTKGPGLGMVLLIQVPLVQKERRFQQGFGGGGGLGGPGAGEYAAKSTASDRRSDVETAVIGHGEVEGPFTEMDNLPIRRDPRFPVRVTVQFYKATSNGVVSEGDLAQIKHDIDSVYAQGENVGSLVTDGNTGRPTEYAGCKVQPSNWWDSFWQRYEHNTGLSRVEARQRLIQLLGQRYYGRPVSELYLRDLLKKSRNS